MMQPSNREKAIDYLRGLRLANAPELRKALTDQEAAQDTYHRVFLPELLPQLSASGFNAFLRYENDRHWWGAAHHGELVETQMTVLRPALTLLLDESVPIADRLDSLTGEDRVEPGTSLDRDAITPILHFVYPAEYGVWNDLARSAMHYLGLYPSLRGLATFGTQYQVVNQTLRGVAREAGLDLGTLDCLWWLDEKTRAGGSGPAPKPEPARTKTKRPASPTRRPPPRAARRTSQPTFICTACFGTKVEHLRVPDTDMCVDCVRR